MSLFELENVSYSYDGIPALSDITLSIDAGESVSLLGPNEKNKSTLLRVLNGLYFPETGTYAFDGMQINKKAFRDKRAEKKFHQRIGFVFQDPSVQLLCSSVYDEIAFAPRQMGMSEDDVKKRTDDCLQLLGIGGFADRVPYHLSGGEKHKVAVASVLAQDPDVLVMDEPMNGLDPRTRRWLAEFLVQLNNAGKTIIISTHDIEMVNEITKRSILFSSEHKILCDRATQDLLTDTQLLIDADLVDEYYHAHRDHGHMHFHDHE